MEATVSKELYTCLPSLIHSWSVIASHSSLRLLKVGLLIEVSQNASDMDPS